MIINLTKSKCILVFACCLSTAFARAQCPNNEFALANGGTFSGNCTIDVGGSVTITGDVVWTSGTLSITGNDGNLNLEGSITIQNGSTVRVDDNNDGDVDIENGGELIVEAGGTFFSRENIQVHNGASMDISGTVYTETSYIDIDDGASATVNNGGFLDSETDLIIQGDLVVASGGSVNAGEVISVENTGILTVAGTVDSGNDVEIDGGQVTVQNGGELDSGDDIQVFDGGSLTIDVGGLASSSGNNGDVMNSEDDGNPGNDESHGTITVNGTLDVSNDVVILDTTPSSSISGSGTVTADGSFTDEEEGDFYDCGGGGAACTPSEPYTCDETTGCTPGGCPDEDDLEVGGVFCGDCTIDIGGGIDIDENVCWVSGTLTIEGDNDANFNIEDGGNFTIVSGSVEIDDGDLNVENGGALTILEDGSVEVDDVLNVDGTVEMSGDLTTGNDVQIDGGTLAVLDGGNLTSGDDIQVFDGGILVVQEGGTASTTGAHGDVINSEDEGNPDDDESLGTIIIDGTLNVSNDVEILDTNNGPSAAINGTGTIIVDGDFTDEEGGDFENCPGGTCEANAPITCDETTTCSEDNCPFNEDDLENGGTFCGDCYMDVGNSVNITEDVCWVSGTLTIDGAGQEGDFSLEGGVSFTIVSGSVVIDDGDVDIQSGAELVILEDGEFFAGDDISVSEAGAITVDGLLEVADNIEIGETVTGTIVINEGGDLNAESIDGNQPLDPSDLPDNIDLSDGGGLNVNGTTLPVVLISFAGSVYENQQMAYLEWSTATEIDNMGFYIEKSLDGRAFEDIGFVAGKGTTKEIQKYAFLDQNLGKNSYYRLRQVDYDGNREYSDLIFVASPLLSSTNPVTIYPNPTHGYVHINGSSNELYHVQVMDLSGKTLLELNQTTLKEAEQLINNRLMNDKGMFFIKFSNPVYAELIRLIKK